MFTLGYQFMPPGIHAGGLRYHGAAPLASFVHSLGLMEAKALPQMPFLPAQLCSLATKVSYRRRNRPCYSSGD